MKNEKCLKNCSNCYSSKIALYNKVSGKVIKPHCRTYTCPTHGWKKQKELATGLEKWLKQFPVVRMLTFTIRKTNEISAKEFNYLFTRVWHLFITKLRRDKFLSKREQNVQYVKVYELHKVGTLHIHALFSEYIHWTKLQRMWEQSIRTYFSISGKQGNVHLRSSRSAKGGARYVAKYVTKMAYQFGIKIRSWSKSGKVAIFPKRIKTGEWMMLLRDSQEYRLASVGWPIVLSEVPCVTETRRSVRKKPPDWTLFNDYFRILLNHQLKYGSYPNLYLQS